MLAHLTLVPRSMYNNLHNHQNKNFPNTNKVERFTSQNTTSIMDIYFI